MDKHICKAKTIFNNEWAYGYYVKVLWEGEIAHLIVESDTEYQGAGEFAWHGVRRVNPDTICRCIGWYDNHKTPIFERDVVEFTNHSYKERFLIWWSNEMNMMTALPLDGINFNGFDYWNGKYPLFKYSSFCFMMQDPYGDYSDIEVIGNIIDNTNLMEG